MSTKRIVDQPDLILDGVILRKKVWSVDHSVDYTYVYRYDPVSNDLVDASGNVFDSSITYNDKLSLMVRNSGDSDITEDAGDLHYTCVAVTGEGTIQSQGSVDDAVAFTFKKYGKVWIKVYRDGGRCTTHPVTGESLENGWFAQSKTLVIELVLNQKELLIQVVQDDSILEKDIGEPLPENISTLDYDVKILQDSDTLKIGPEIYFVYDSSDFYKPDIFHHANNYDTYDKGIRYTKNLDNSWTIQGQAVGGNSYHPLIMSSEQFPNYLVRDRKYELHMEVLGGTTIPLEVTWYYTDGHVSTQTYTQDAEIKAIDSYSEDSKSKGVVLKGVRIQIYVNQNRSVNSTIRYSLLDVEERYMNNKIESQYPVAARGARIPILRDRAIFDVNFLENQGKDIQESDGIIFTKNYNLNTRTTTWSIQGSSRLTTRYTLVDSREYLPKHMIPGTYLNLTITKSSAPLEIRWYCDQSVLNTQTYNSSTEILVPDSATGVVINILAYSSTSYNVVNVSYILGTKSNLNYKPKIKYRSAKMKFVNTQYYRIFTTYNTKMGEVDVIRSAKPFDEIEFTVTPYVGVIYDPTSIVVQYYDDSELPHRIHVDNVTENKFLFEMPISSVEIIVFFNYVSYTHEIPDGVSPYIDVGPWGSSRPIRISQQDNDYWDALMFCYYARQHYFGEDLPLMQGIGNSRFYEEDSDGETMPYLRRRDLVAVIHRISHMDKYTIPSGSTTTVAKYPREDPYLTTEVIVNPASTEFNNKIADESNAPRTRLYKYARPRIDISSSYDTSDSDVTYYGNMRSSPSNTFSDPLNADNGYARKNGYANEDYLGAFNSFPDIDWATFIGVANGYSELSFGPNKCCTFEEASAMLWRYARFRQIDIRVNQDYTYLDEDVSYWAQRGPVQWVLSNGISTGYHVRTNRSSSSVQVRMKPSDLLDRAEFAYMVMKFCMLYAW